MLRKRPPPVVSFFSSTVSTKIGLGNLQLCLVSILVSFFWAGLCNTELVPLVNDYEEPINLLMGGW